jgi:hypothetical protein
VVGTHAIRAVLLALLPLGAALHALAAAAPEWVERVYARGVYPVVVWLLAPLSSALAFSLAEWLAGLLALVLVGVAVARWRRSRRAGVARLRLAGAGLVWLAGLAGLFYLWFLLAWGLNHQRPAVAELTGLDARPARPSELAALCAELVEGANRLREGRLEDSAGVMRLAAGRAASLARAGEGFAAVARETGLAIPQAAQARLKRPLVSPLLWRLGITGIYIPFTAEAHVNDTVPDPELPFVAAHELAHRSGFAREDEASWVGQAACARHPDPDHRYSGILAMSLHAIGALVRVDRGAASALSADRSPAVRRDVEALRAWSDRYQGAARRVARRVNDTYLKSQGHADGVRSYGRVVDLLLAERRARLAAAPGAGS